MKYVIEFQKAAIKFLKKQDKNTQQRLLTAINQLPEGKDIKHLKGCNLYRVRVGTIRILYSIDEGIKIITIENIGNRGDVYKRY
jgi:mRNA interferase RelE/StbE